MGPWVRGPHVPRANTLAHLGLPVGLIGLIVTQHLCGKTEIGLYVHVHGAATLLFLRLDLVKSSCESKITSVTTLDLLQVEVSQVLPTHTLAHTHAHAHAHAHTHTRTHAHTHTHRDA